MTSNDRAETREAMAEYFSGIEARPNILSGVEDYGWREIVATMAKCYGGTAKYSPRWGRFVQTRRFFGVGK